MANHQYHEYYTRLAIDRTEPKKKIRFAEQKIRFDFFGSTPTRPGRNLTRTFPKTEAKFGLQNLPIAKKKLLQTTGMSFKLSAQSFPRSAQSSQRFSQTGLSQQRQGLQTRMRYCWKALFLPVQFMQAWMWYGACHRRCTAKNAKSRGR